MKTADYIELARKLTQTGSYYAVAKLLDLDQATIRRYRSGERVMDNDTCRRLAEVLNRSVEELIASAEVERRAPGDPARDAWEKRLKALGRRAAAALVACLTAAAFPSGEGPIAGPMPYTAQAAWSAYPSSTPDEESAATSWYYVKWWRRAWRALRTWSSSALLQPAPLRLIAPCGG